MNLDKQQEYVEDVATVLTKKISSMHNVNDSAIDHKNINILAYKSAVNLLKIGFIRWGEYGLFDEFTAEQLDNNCRVGEFQIFFEDYIGTTINVDRYGADDLSDLSIRMINDSGDNKIVVVESKDDETIQIKGPSKELRFQGGRLRILDEQAGMTEFSDVKDVNLETAVELFNTDVKTLYTTGLPEGIEEEKSHSAR